MWALRTGSIKLSLQKYLDFYNFADPSVRETRFSGYAQSAVSETSTLRGVCQYILRNGDTGTASFSLSRYPIHNQTITVPNDCCELYIYIKKKIIAKWAKIWTWRCHQTTPSNTYGNKQWHNANTSWALTNWLSTSQQIEWQWRLPLCPSTNRPL